MLTSNLLATVVADRLRRKSEAALEAAKQAALDAAMDFGPTQSTGHPYSTGRFVRSLAWRGMRLVSTVDYAYYTDRGYTRYGGEGSAKRWKERGGIRFGQHYEKLFLAVFREAFKRAI